VRLSKNISFSKRVTYIVSCIPEGSVLTYKEVAFKAGSENASRVVGTIMSKNQNLDIPCHRVIRSDGTLGEYNGLKGKKSDLLSKEGYPKTS